MAGRRPARFLAPMALVVFGIVLVIVLASAGGGGASKSSARTSRTTTVTHARSVSRPRRYVVKSGDNSLDEIARKTGVHTDRLLELNPALDPQSLTPGQSLKLR